MPEATKKPEADALPAEHRCPHTIRGLPPRDLPRTDVWGRNHNADRAVSDYPLRGNRLAFAASNVSAEAHDVFAQFVAGRPHACARLGLVEAIPDCSDASQIAR